jgi:hypothetical protein
LLCFCMHIHNTESLQPVLTGVVTTKMVVTTLGGVVTTPISPCFGVRTLTTGSLPPIELQRSHIQAISSPRSSREEVRPLPSARRRPDARRPMAATPAQSPPPASLTYDRRFALAHRHGDVDIIVQRERVPPLRRACATNITNQTEPRESAGEIRACPACQRGTCPASLPRVLPRPTVAECALCPWRRRLSLLWPPPPPRSSSRPSSSSPLSCCPPPSPPSRPSSSRPPPSCPSSSGGPRPRPPRGQPVLLPDRRRSRLLLAPPRREGAGCRGLRWSRAACRVQPPPHAACRTDTLAGAKVGQATV